MKTFFFFSFFLRNNYHDYRFHVLELIIEILQITANSLVSVKEFLKIPITQMRQVAPLTKRCFVFLALTSVCKARNRLIYTVQIIECFSLSLSPSPLLNYCTQLQTQHGFSTTLGGSVTGRVTRARHNCSNPIQLKNLHYPPLSRWKHT